jgi:uncharacterized protein
MHDSPAWLGCASLKWGELGAASASMHGKRSVMWSQSDATCWGPPQVQRDSGVSLSMYTHAMSRLPVFPLFLDPVRENVIEPSGAACGICGQSRGYVYTGPHYGELSDVTICPWCIADGSACSRGISFNNATILPLLDSTPQMNSEDQRLVEGCTPGFTTWQGNRWLMCCGRACLYLGEAESADLRGRWAEAVPSMFQDDGYPPDEIEYVLNHVNKGGGPSCAYVFQCQVCKALRGYWDCH